MNEESHSDRPKALPIDAHPPMPLEQFLAEVDMTRARCGQLRKNGWLKTIEIGGRQYVQRSAIVEFNERAARGEFARGADNRLDVIQPEPGEFRTIADFLSAVLGDQSDRFCCWLKVGYDALRAGVRRPGQALIIVGPSDCGKSRIQHQIITPILGGRSADPKSFFFGKTDFNAELIGAEHLLLEEVPSSSRHEERLFFGERIKEVVANDTVRLDKKNRDAVTVSPFWRLSITLNDDPEKLRCLPPLTEDMAEKIIMIHARSAPEFWKRFAEAPDPRAAFRDAISGEMPAFAHALTQQPIPEKLQGRRYGVASYIPEEIGAIIFEGEPEHHLMILIEKGLFQDGSDDAWTGDAQGLKDQLLAEDSPVRGSARRLLDPVQPSTLAIWLRHLATKFPGRFRCWRSSDRRCWQIQRPKGVQK